MLYSAVFNNCFSRSVLLPSGAAGQHTSLGRSSTAATFIHILSGGNHKHGIAPVAKVATKACKGGIKVFFSRNFDASHMSGVRASLRGLCTESCVQMWCGSQVSMKTRLTLRGLLQIFHAEAVVKKCGTAQGPTRQLAVNCRTFLFMCFSMP